MTCDVLTHAHIFPSKILFWNILLRKNTCCAHENNESQISDEREHAGQTSIDSQMRLLLDRIIGMTLKDLNPGTCMALPRKITLEIECNFPTVGLYSNYHRKTSYTMEVWETAN